jgi:proton-translocating NADH-quinone oxidoreductase chain L
MFSTISVLPLISAIFIVLFGSWIGTIGCLILSCTNLFTAWILSLSYFWGSSYMWTYYADVWTWVTLNIFHVTFSLRYDSLTALMFIVVTTISTIVHIYSSVYMYTDPFLARFMSYLSLFTFFMLLLVSSGNLLVLFMGWEGVGLCSYLLIGFWHTRAQAGKAATKAFIINKIGDLFFLTGIGLVFVAFHSLEFTTIGLLISFGPTDIVELTAIFLFLGAVGKSAQVGLHTWLPDAMEGPTPVSALIHAATMVTAGVFLVIRCSAILEFAPRILFLIAIWGGITALVSGTIGAVQSDIKKIIAYSTCSQLGYMILACGLSLYDVGFFHLFNHAFFKALLFLSAGSVIHLMSNEQDIRQMGGLGRPAPFIYINVLLGSLALAGFPFLAGFYSKDLIIEAANTKYWGGGQVLYWFATIAAMLTMYYSVRLIYLVFLDVFKGFKLVIVLYHPVTRVEIFLLGFLGLLSLGSGYYFKDSFAGLGSAYFNNSIFSLPTHWSFINLEFIPVIIKLTPVISSVLAFWLVIFLSRTGLLGVAHLETTRVYFEVGKWFYNESINRYIALPGLVVGRHFFEQYEKRVLEYYGPGYCVLLLQKLY